MNTLRIALGIFSGKIILNFGVQKRLRAFLNPIFMERVTTGNGSCRAGCLRKIDFHGKRRFPLEKKPIVRYTEYNESYKKE